MIEQRDYDVPGDEATIGHADAVYQVDGHRVTLPVAPWTAELETRGIIVPRDALPAVEIPQALVEAGFTTPESISAASDEELLAVSGVGKATVAKLREALS